MFSDGSTKKNIWILWLQGWENANWLNYKVVESWELHNPDWNVIKLSLENLRDYVTDIDYIYDESKTISPQAKSDIIRLSLMKNYGGVWADATMLCMQPLDSWVHEKVEPAGMWMYHGYGGGMNICDGPASWFMVSLKNSYIFEKWKEQCDEYWKSHNSTDNYFWMDYLFKELFETDQKFREIWGRTPYISCEEYGQAHTLSGKMFQTDLRLQHIFRTNPPYALKLWKDWNDVCGKEEPTNPEVFQYNGYVAIRAATMTD